MVLLSSGQVNAGAVGPGPLEDVEVDVSMLLADSTVEVAAVVSGEDSDVPETIELSEEADGDCSTEPDEVAEGLLPSVLPGGALEETNEGDSDEDTGTAVTVSVTTTGAAVLVV